MNYAHKLMGWLAGARSRLKNSGDSSKERSFAQQDEAGILAEGVINTVREPLLTLDQNLRVVMASRSFYNFFKVKPEETVGQLIYDLGNNQWDIPKLRELLETILPEKSTFDDYEVEHDFATIGRRVMLLNARQIKRASGQERIILLAIEDITERKEIEDGLERTRKNLAISTATADEAHAFADSVINTLREPLLSLDQDLRVVTASRSFYEFFKVKPKETIGQLIYNLGNNQWDIPKLRELLETILPEKSSFDDYEVEHGFATIGRRVMLLNARQIKRASGQEKIILLAIEDITDRNAWERSFLDLNERLQVSNRELEELGHSLSHDLRGPIQSIEAFSSILLEVYAEKLDAEGKQIVKSVKETAHRMYDMIFGLLSISRITRAEIHRDRIDLTALVHTVFLELQKAEPAREAEIAVEEGLFAEGDAKLLRMALDNLIGNSWKFTRKQPRARIEFGRTEHSGTTAFFLRDNGAGFDMNSADKLFTVFQRLHTDEEFEGTGVGLATVQRIIHRHAGEIWAEGEVDKGATFYFTLK